MTEDEKESTNNKNNKNKKNNKDNNRFLMQKISFKSMTNIENNRSNLQDEIMVSKAIIQKNKKRQIKK